MRASIVRASVTVEESLLPDRGDLMSHCTFGSTVFYWCSLLTCRPAKNEEQRALLVTLVTMQ